MHDKKKIVNQLINLQCQKMTYHEFLKRDLSPNYGLPTTGKTKNTYRHMNYKSCRNNILLVFCRSSNRRLIDKIGL